VSLFPVTYASWLVKEWCWFEELTPPPLYGTSLARNFAYCYRCYRSVVCLSVCLSVTFVHCAQTAEDIDTIRFLLRTTAQCLSLQDRIIIWFTSFNIFPNFAPKWANPCYLSVGDTQWQIAVEWLETAQWSQWRAYRKPPSLFRMVRSMTPYDLPSPKRGSKCDRFLLRTSMSPFAKFLWPLFPLSINPFLSTVRPFFMTNSGIVSKRLNTSTKVFHHSRFHRIKGPASWARGCLIVCLNQWYFNNCNWN